MAISIDRAPLSLRKVTRQGQHCCGKTVTGLAFSQPRSFRL
jgi:hypothetical protein